MVWSVWTTANKESFGQSLSIFVVSYTKEKQ